MTFERLMRRMAAQSLRSEADQRLRNADTARAMGRPDVAKA